MATKQAQDARNGTSGKRAGGKPLATRANRLQALRTAYTKEAAICRWNNGVPLFGEGDDKDPRMCFVVLSPSQFDVERGKHFMSGRESVVFNDMLSSLGMTRADVYVTALCKWATPTHRIVESPVAVRHALTHLTTELTLVNPRNVVLLGRRISEIFVPDIDLVREHGHVVEGNRWNYIPMYHPENALVNMDIAHAMLRNTAQLNHLVGKA